MLDSFNKVHRSLKGFVPNYPVIWSFLAIILIVIMGYFGWYHVKVFQVQKTLYQAVLQGVDKCVTSESKILSNYALLKGKSIGDAIKDTDCSPIPCFPETRSEAKSLGKVGNGTRPDYDLVQFSYQELAGGQKESNKFPDSLEFGEVIIDPGETFCTWQAPGVGNCCVTTSNTRIGSSDICCVCQISAKLVHYPFGNIGKNIWGFKQKEFKVSSQAEAGVTPTGLEKKITTKPGEFSSMCAISINAPPPASPTPSTPETCDPKCECCNPCGSTPSLSDSDPRECDPGCYSASEDSTCGICDPATECCAGETYPSDPSCPCDSATQCCPGDTYTTNPTHCPCDSATECCPGNTYPGNANCPCDSATQCCPGDTYATNPTHCPQCQSSTTCCPGDTYATNPTHCPCDSATECCPGDTQQTNPTHCPCDSATECCPGDTPANNTNCQTACLYEFKHVGANQGKVDNEALPLLDKYVADMGLRNEDCWLNMMDGTMQDCLPDGSNCTVDVMRPLMTVPRQLARVYCQCRSPITGQVIYGHWNPSTGVVIGCEPRAAAFGHFSTSFAGGASTYYDKDGNEVQLTDYKDPNSTDPNDTRPLGEVCGAAYTPISFVWNFDEEKKPELKLSAVQFPLDNISKNKWFAWYGSATHPLLVHDKHNDKNITSAEELFGNYTFGKNWDNGYEAMASLDTNHNNILEGIELKGLSLWFDADQNGVSHPIEIKSLKELNITKIFLRPSSFNIFTGDVFASIGFERTIGDKKYIGESIDWYSAGPYDSKEEVLKYSNIQTNLSQGNTK